LVARTITGIGVLVKRIALILGGCILLVAMIELYQNRTPYALMEILVAFAVAIPIYVLGILVAAQGEILKATLDTAVTNSPFLKTEEMATVMSLRP
jgi:Flp pilus assembly protein TadB